MCSPKNLSSKKIHLIKPAPDSPLPFSSAWNVKNVYESPKAVKTAANFGHSKFIKEKSSKHCRLPRPFNRYNLFFILEREHLIHARGGNASRQSVIKDNEDQEAKIALAYGNGSEEKIIDATAIANVKDGDYSSLFYPLSLPPLPKRYSSISDLYIPSDWYVSVSKEKKKLRSHTKTHGVANFVDLAKAIGANWKAVQDEAKRGDPNAGETLIFFAEVEKKIKKRHEEISSILTKFVKPHCSPNGNKKESNASGVKEIHLKKHNLREHAAQKTCYNSNSEIRPFSQPEASATKDESTSLILQESTVTDSFKEQDQPKHSSNYELICCIQCNPPPIRSPVVSKAVLITPQSSNKFDRILGSQRECGEIMFPELPMPPLFTGNLENRSTIRDNVMGRQILNDVPFDYQNDAPDDLVMQDFCEVFDFDDVKHENIPACDNVRSNYYRSRSTPGNSFGSHGLISNIGNETRNVKRNFGDNNGMENDAYDEEVDFQEFVRQVRMKSSVSSISDDPESWIDKAGCQGQSNNFIDQEKRNYHRSASDGCQPHFKWS